MTSINPQNIWVLSALDKLISENKTNSGLVCALFEKKEMILGLLQGKKLDAHKYKTIVAKAYKEESGTIKSCAEADIFKLKDPKDPKMLEEWFKEILIAAGAPYETQKKLYAHYKNQLAQSNLMNKPVEPVPPSNYQPTQTLPKVLPTQPPPILKPIQPVLPTQPPVYPPPPKPQELRHEPIF
jgi:hypothetical protein